MAPDLRHVRLLASAEGPAQRHRPGAGGPGDQRPRAHAGRQRRQGERTGGVEHQRDGREDQGHQQVDGAEDERAGHGAGEPVGEFRLLAFDGWGHRAKLAGGYGRPRESVITDAPPVRVSDAGARSCSAGYLRSWRAMTIRWIWLVPS
ncbi:hypothetical protein GCM10009727_18530 [Actinomadura napierensis]|uniref:Uncharacterized protein n=1 Tax=Actinomadura napierensis TaxID=267854 RepID=A0ABP5K6Z2_9ACTN